MMVRRSRPLRSAEFGRRPPQAREFLWPAIGVQAWAQPDGARIEPAGRRPCLAPISG